MTPQSNRILAGIGSGAFAQVRDHLSPVTLRAGDVLNVTDDAIDRMIFPSSGLISLFVELNSGDRIEIGRIGRDGALGGAVLFGCNRQINISQVRISGDAWSLGVDRVIGLANESPLFTKMVFANERFLSVQAQQSAACTARHHIVQRLATRLLRIRDLSGEQDVPLTHADLAEMLGVQRATLSVAAAELKRHGLIRYVRGRISVVDQERLHAMACECVFDLERQWRQHLAA